MVPGLTAAVSGFIQSMRRRVGSAEPAVESRRELSARYLRELDELVDDRQISRSDAKKVVEDLFEPGEPGSARRVRLAVWRSYLTERTGQSGLRLVRDEPESGNADDDRSCR